MAATESLLRSRLSAEALNNNGVPWSSIEAAVQVLADAIGNINVTIDPGNVTVGSVNIDQTTPGTTNGVVVNSSALPTGAATQATLAAVLAKLLAAPATEAKQDSGNSSLATLAAVDFATQATLAAILAKLIAAPATSAKQDTGNTSLASIDGKITAVNTGAIAGTVTANPGTGTRTLGGGAAVTTDGTVTSGKYGVTFIFSSDFAGTIAGTPFTGANDRSFTTPPLPAAHTYGAIVYTVSGGSMRIIPVT